MASQIKWNGRTLTLSRPFSSWREREPAEQDVNIARDGTREYVTRRVSTEVEATYRNPTAAERLELRNMARWARLGNAIEVSYDSALDGETTVDAASASGQAVLNVTATADFGAGEQVIIRDLTGLQVWEDTIDALTAGVSFTMTSNLLYSFASNDIVRHWRHFDEVWLENAAEILQLLDLGRSNVPEIRMVLSEKIPS